MFTVDCSPSKFDTLTVNKYLSNENISPSWITFFYTDFRWDMGGSNSSSYKLKFG